MKPLIFGLAIGVFGACSGPDQHRTSTMELNTSVAWADCEQPRSCGPEEFCALYRFRTGDRRLCAPRGDLCAPIVCGQDAGCYVFTGAEVEPACGPP